MKIDRTKEEKRWVTKTIGREVETERYSQNSSKCSNDKQGKPAPCQQAITTSAILSSNAQILAEKPVQI